MSINGERMALLDLRSVPYYYIRGGAAGRTGDSARNPVAGEGRTADDHRHVHQENRARTSTTCFNASMRRRPILQTGVQYGYTTVPHLSGVEILGPYAIGGPGDTPSRAASSLPSGFCERRAGCAKKIVSSLGSPRISPAGTDTDIDPLLNFYRAGGRHPEISTKALRWRCGGFWPIRSSFFGLSGILTMRAAGSAHRDQRYRTGVAPFVLPVEQYSG